jgi:putative ABC transport system ATP-binding protein
VVVVATDAPSSSSHLLQVEHLTRSYQSGDGVLNALDDVSFAVDRGELVAIMGTSGSGKSTLMNLLGCLDRPSSGRYLLDGRDVSGLSKPELALVRNRTLGFVFQSFNLLARTSALENVELPLLYRQPAPTTAERHAAATQALTRVGLAHRLGHHPSQLSGGQQQRVAIARALVTAPKIVLADEPTGNLDTRTSLEVMALFQQLSNEGITVVLVTHEPDIAHFATRVLVMRDGRLRSDERQRPPDAAAELQALEPAPAPSSSAASSSASSSPASSVLP